MLIDYNLRFSAGVSAVGNSAARQVGTYTVDTKVAGDAAEPLMLHFLVNTTFTGAASTYDLVLETHTADDFAAARTVMWEKRAIPLATMAAKYEVVVPVPPGALRYICFVLIPQTANCTGGTYTVELVRSVQTNK
jgi:hypothetical protein